jgi:hypothetical protein
VEASYALTNNTGWDGIKSNYLGEGWTGDTTVTWTNVGPVIQIFAEDNDPFTPRRGMRLRVERP